MYRSNSRIGVVSAWRQPSGAYYTETPHFEIKVTGVQRVTQCRRRLRRPPESKHALAPWPRPPTYQLPRGPPAWHRGLQGAWWIIFWLVLQIRQTTTR